MSRENSLLFCLVLTEMFLIGQDFLDHDDYDGDDDYDDCPGLPGDSVHHGARLAPGEDGVGSQALRPRRGRVNQPRGARGCDIFGLFCHTVIHIIQGKWTSISR